VTRTLESFARLSRYVLRGRTGTRPGRPGRFAHQAPKDIKCYYSRSSGRVRTSMSVAGGACLPPPVRKIRVLAMMESQWVTGPAKNLNSPSAGTCKPLSLRDLPAVELSVIAFDRPSSPAKPVHLRPERSGHPPRHVIREAAPRRSTGHSPTRCHYPFRETAISCRRIIPSSHSPGAAHGPPEAYSMDRGSFMVSRRGDAREPVL